LRSTGSRPELAIPAELAIRGTLIRLKNPEVRNFDDYRLDVEQEKCSQWFFVNVVQTF